MTDIINEYGYTDELDEINYYLNAESAVSGYDYTLRYESYEYDAEYHAEYYQKNRHRHRALTRRNQIENADRYAVYASNYRARKLRATAELTDYESTEIKKLYTLARDLEKATGVKYHVDHIYPLSRGGKHILSNLQVITASENAKKHAKVTVDKDNTYCEL